MATAEAAVAAAAASDDAFPTAVGGADSGCVMGAGKAAASSSLVAGGPSALGEFYYTVLCT